MIIEFTTLAGTLTAKKVLLDAKTAGGTSNNIENGEAQESYFIELNFPAAPSNEFNSGEVSFISNALGGASIIDIRRTTVTDDLLASPRGGAVGMHLDEQNQRVLLRGNAVTVMEGTVLV
ncbi:hypothetical protein ACE6H2_028581 [Prunus campanulata]